MTQPLTTGEVARACGVSTSKVVVWIESGLLTAWRVPGSRHRRVSVEVLREFIARHGLPLEPLETILRERG